MNVRTMAGLVVLSLASLGTVSVMAHHAFDTEFDAKKPVTLTGVVTKVEWTNPHVWFYLNVKNEKSGEVENWGFELASPNGLMRNGWTRFSLKPGDVVTIEGSRAKNGSTNANAQVVVSSNGQRLFAGSSQAQQP